jgi:hypothetical protein
MLNFLFEEQNSIICESPAVLDYFAVKLVLVC